MFKNYIIQKVLALNDKCLNKIIKLFCAGLQFSFVACLTRTHTHTYFNKLIKHFAVCTQNRFESLTVWPFIRSPCRGQCRGRECRCGRRCARRGSSWPWRRSPPRSHPQSPRRCSCAQSESRSAHSRFHGLRQMEGNKTKTGYISDPSTIAILNSPILCAL